MTQPRWTVSPSVLRADADNPRAVEGIAVPYGEVWESPTGYREAFAPGAFAAEAERWNNRQDGARLPFLRSHTGREFLGGVTELRDLPEGLWFRAELRDIPATADYLAEVEAGANGTSVEFAPVRSNPRGGQDRKTTIHSQARLGAIAGALTPAYDSARVAARSEMEMLIREEQAPTEPEEPKEPEPKEPDAPSEPEPTQLQRRTAEAAAMTASAQRGPAFVTRSERIYGPTSEHGFVRDFVAAHRGDAAAAERQHRHYAQLDEVAAYLERAGEVLSSEIPGAYPTEFMPGLLVPRILKGRPMASFFSRVPISDARPRTFAKVTTSTTAAAQSAEGANPAASDFATTPTTVTPVLIGAEIKVSRQVLDGADPAAEGMLFEDLMEAYAQASETAVVAAAEAVNIAGAAITLATPHAGVVDAIVGYQVARFMPAEGVFLPAAAYSNLLKQVDAADGRLLVPWLGPTNASGQQEAGAAGAAVLGVPIMLSWASAAGAGITGRRTDMVVYESSVARFTYEQGPEGPSAVRIGVWAYLAAAARRGPIESAIA